jgi:predicted RNA-binding Zn-ribbon protein involved in translation (DUF1610 family)
MSIKTQDAFMDKRHSQPVICPACYQTHTINELKKKSDSYPNFKCPKTGKEIIHQVGLWGGDQWFDLKEEIENGNRNKNDNTNEDLVVGDESNDGSV